MRLRMRFTIALVLAAIVPLAVVASFVGRDLTAGWRHESMEAHQSKAVLAAFAVETYLQRTVDLVAIQARGPLLAAGLRTGARAKIAEALRDFDHQRAGFETVFVLDAGGTTRYNPLHPALEGRDFSQRDYFQGVLSTGKPYLSTPYLGQATRQPRIGIAAPIRDEGGRLWGVLVGTLTLRALDDMLERVPHQHGELMVVGPGGVILAHREASRLMQPASANPAVPRVLAGQSGGVEWADAAGRRQLSAFAPVAFVGWGLVDTHPLQEIHAPIRKGLQRTVLFTVLAVAAAGLGGALLAQSLARPILRLRQGVRRLAAGDLRARLNLPRRDELGELAADVDAMGDELEAKVAELERRMRELALLQEIDRGILAGTPIPELLQPTLQEFAELAGSRTCLLVVPEGAEGLLRLLVAFSSNSEGVGRFFNELRPRVGEGAAGLAIATRAPVACADVAAETRLGRLREALVAAGVRATVAVPLVAGEEVLGAVSLTYPDPRPFSEADLQALQRFGNQLGVALQQSGLREAAADRFRLEETSRVKSLFLANMSHEIRTPLNAMLGFSEMLQMEAFGPLNEKQRRYVGHVHQAGKHLLGLINDILDLSKAEAGQFTLSPEAVPLAPTLEAALLIVNGQAAKKRLRLTLEADARLDTVWADPIRLKQMLYNLLSNAVKFTPEGGQVVLKARPAGSDVEIAVSDTGIGMRPEDLPRLFTEFSQLGPQRHEGTGLGLALTKRLVELHGGTIQVESAPGRGSTFLLTLPARPPLDGAASSEPVGSPPRGENQPKAA